MAESTKASIDYPNWRLWILTILFDGIVIAKLVQVLDSIVRDGTTKRLF